MTNRTAIPSRIVIPSRQRGVSLIELMIAMTIGLFLLTALASIYLGASNSNKELARASRQIEDGRYAVQVLSEDVALAGYYGYYHWPAVPAALPDPCELIPLQASTRVPIQGYNSPATPPAPLSGCLADNDHVAGTDVLVIRRAETNVTALADLVTNQVYIQANSDPTSASPIISTGTAGNFPLRLKDNLPTNLAPVRKMHVHIYFVAPCSVPNGGGVNCTGANDDNGRPIPTLKRLDLTLNAAGTLAWVVTPIAEGVENLQLEYGLDANGDGVPDGAFTAAPAAAADWANVVAVNAFLLVRNAEPTPDFTDMKTYSLGPAAGTVTSTANGGTLDPNYKRKAYNAQIRIVNISSRREAP